MPGADEPGPPEHADASAELRAREPIFHRPELGTARADFAAMLAEDFREIGASGRSYDREQVLDVLERRHGDGPPDERLEVLDFRCRAVGPATYLVTYSLRQDGTRLTRRSTLWARTEAGWKALYHQGTLAPIRDAAG